MKDTRDAFDPPERGRFGDNEIDRRSGPGPRVTGASDLLDLTLILRNDNPAKKAIAVSRKDDTAFEDWVWLPRSLIEYEMSRGVGCAVIVTLPRRLAGERGLI